MKPEDVPPTPDATEVTEFARALGCMLAADLLQPNHRQCELGAGSTTPRDEPPGLIHRLVP